MKTHQGIFRWNTQHVSINCTDILPTNLQILRTSHRWGAKKQNFLDINQLACWRWAKTVATVCDGQTDMQRPLWSKCVLYSRLTPVCVHYCQAPVNIQIKVNETYPQLYVFMFFFLTLFISWTKLVPMSQTQAHPHLGVSKQLEMYYSQKLFLILMLWCQNTVSNNTMLDLPFQVCWIS